MGYHRPIDALRRWQWYVIVGFNVQLTRIMPYAHIGLRTNTLQLSDNKLNAYVNTLLTIGAVYVLYVLNGLVKQQKQ